MKVSEIIEEIAALPLAEQREVILYARKLEEESPLSPAELGILAQQLASCTNDQQAATLKQKIMNGFYGGERRA
jgi:hypothetical protein